MHVRFFFQILDFDPVRVWLQKLSSISSVLLLYQAYLRQVIFDSLSHGQQQQAPGAL